MLWLTLLVLGAAAPPTPPIVARADWDDTLAEGTPPALPGVTRYPPNLAAVLDGIVVHHSDFVDAKGPAAILAYHLEVSGFADIGYHFVIGQDGTIYEGRALDAVGAHAGQSTEANRGVRDARRRGGADQAAHVDRARAFDPDYGAIGIVLDGYYADQTPPRAQRRALTDLVQHLRHRYRIARDAVIAHREVKQRRVEDRGLHFTGPTSVCPGDAGYRWFLLWRGALPRAVPGTPRPGPTSTGAAGGVDAPRRH